MITRLKLPLDEDEYTALAQIALVQLRNPVDQAHYIVRCELQRYGLLRSAPADVKSQEEPDEQHADNSDRARSELPT